MENRSLIIRVVSLIVIGVLMGVSIWFGSACASTESFHHEDIAYLESKKNNAKALSASASAVSVLVSLLPEDTATPMANQISDIGRDFMIVLAALAAEQNLLTITGRITFCWIIPISLGILVLFVLLRRKLFMQIGVKLALTGCVLYLLVPLTLRITRLADSAYQDAVDSSLQQSQEIENAFHYNESGIVMPGMSEGTAMADTEAVSAPEPQPETQTGLHTEASPVIQTEFHTEARPAEQTELHTEVRPAVQTELNTDAQADIQAEARAEAVQAQTEKPAKKKAKKLPWYERLWNYITGADSDKAQAGSGTEAGIQAQTEKPVKKKAKKLPWYERLWNTITGAETVEAQDIIRTEAETEAGRLAALQTEAGSMAVLRTEAFSMAETEETAKEQTENPAREQPWYERLWNGLTDAASNAADKVSQIPGRVSDTASGVANKLSETASAAADKVAEAGEKASELAALTLEIPQMAADLLNSLIDAFVLMIVTTCVLPIVVLIGLLWIVNQLLNIHLDWEKMTL